VVQEAAPCAFDVRPGNLTISPAGGSIAASVSALNGCTWAASVNVSWITVTSGARGNGDGAATFSVAANTGPLRSANITIAGQTFSVTQDASGSVSSGPGPGPAPAPAPSGGGGGKGKGKGKKVSV
jgi:Putative binding domain, N-terminal